MSFTARSAVGAAGAVLLLAAAAAMAGPGDGLVEDFTSGSGLPNGWRPSGGTWRVAEGALVVDSLGGVACITCGDPAWQNYEIEVTATFLKTRDDSRWLAIVFRAAPDGSPSWSQFPVRLKTTGRNGTEFAVRLKGDRWSVRKSAPAEKDSELGRARRLRVVVRGEQVEGYLDGKRVIRSAYCVDRARGCPGLAASGCLARFDDFRVRRLPDTPPPTAPPKPCKVVAHRGFSAAAPENTLAAVSAAIRAGADGCEFDVYATRDGHVVLLHDKTVERTTDGRGKVTELTLAELKRLDAGSWKDPKFAGQRVPTLEEALAALKKSECRPVIEIKMEGIAAKVIEAVRAAGLMDRAAVIAFSKDVVKEVRRLEPRLECGWLSSKELEGTPARQAQWIAAEAAECHTDLVDLDYRMLSPGLVAELHRRGLRVWTWTVDEPPVMRALMRWGVEAVTTNRPDLLRGEVRRAQGFPANGVTAHRGFSAKYPENTLPAFQAGIEAGADWLECDVFRTRDGRLVVIHDATTARVGDRSVEVNAVTYDELKGIDVAHRFRQDRKLGLQACPPQQVPLLEEVLRLVLGRDKARLSIQPKDDSTGDALELVERLGAGPWVGFNDGSLQKMALVKRLAPAIPVFWDRPPDTDVMHDIPIALEHGFEALVIHHSGVDRAKIHRLHAAGLEAGAWTVNDPAAMRRLLGLGIDRIYTDDPALLLRVRQEAKQASRKAGS